MYNGFQIRVYGQGALIRSSDLGKIGRVCCYAQKYYLFPFFLLNKVD